VIAGDGSDLIIGGDGLGNDIYNGGDGIDIVKYTSALAGIVVNLNAGFATTKTTSTSFTSLEAANRASLDFSNIGNDTLINFENIIASNFNDVLIGNTSNNVLTGLAGNDTMLGGLGNDIYVVDSTSDVIVENRREGADTIQTTLLTYSIAPLTHMENLSFIGTGNASLTGNTSNNVLTGLAGNDTLNGGTGNDTMLGGLGNDTLTGGTGMDIFLFNAALNATSNIDTITDFSHIDDTIQLSKSVMSALGELGTLSVDDFKFSTEALDSSDRIIYNQTSGALFFDEDGSDATAAIQIALLGATTHPTNIDYTDFVIV
jgi:Ca2+-binding RTX toxin-like protein